MQTQTSNTLHNAIIEAGGKDRLPMLAPDKQVPISEEIDNDIYSTVDACPNACEMRKAIERHVARECQKPKRVKDAAYHQEKMLLSKQEEAGIQLNAEQADWRDDTDDESEDHELEAHYMYMAQIQENDDDADLDNKRELLASLIEKLKCEIDDRKNRKKFLETSNKVLIEQLKGEITDFKNKNKSLESSNNRFKEANNKLSKTNKLMYNDFKKSQAELQRRNDVEYASKVEIDCAKAKGDLISYKMESQKSFNKYTQTINDLNQTISKMKKKLCAHQETTSILSQQKEAQIKLYKTHEDKELDKVIALENKVKVLDNIVYKTGQSVQTMNMLNNKCQTSFAKPKAQRPNPRLYDIGCYNDNLALMLAPKSDELVEIVLFIVDSGCSKHMTGNLKLLINFVEKFLGTVKFGNDQIAPILGYRDLIIFVLRVSWGKPNESLFTLRLPQAQKDGYNFYTWTYVVPCASKDETPEVLIEFLRLVQRGLHAQERIVRTDKGMELLNKTLHAYFASEGILHQTVFYSVKSLQGVQQENKSDCETIHVNFDELPQMASDHVSSDPVPQYRTVTTSNELDLLFSLMFDELLNGSSKVVSKSFVVTSADALNQHQQQHTTPLNNQTTRDPTCQVPPFAPTVASTENMDQAEMVEEYAQVKNDEFINIFCTPVQGSGDTSSHYVDSSNMHTFYQHHPSKHRWTKDHPLEQVTGNASQSVRTRRQLESVEELHQFDQLDVCIGTPMATKHLDADLSGTSVYQTKYRSMVGALMYLTASRPDIMHATCYCARYQAKPTEKHLTAVKRIFRYLKDTIYIGLWYPKDTGFELTAFLDSDHAGCLDLRKSTFGGIQFLGGDKLVSWSSKKQDCTSMSFAEAEYVSLSACCAQVLWMRTQLTYYGFHFDKIPMYCDSKAAIAISCNLVQHSRTKHIDVRYHFIKEKVEKGIVELFFVRTEYQLANLFTKALPEERFKYLVRRLGMRCLTLEELEVLSNKSA
nr:retrovirus-related Pol polyprotein from transposon TNT 1-94 [Tanacetum cinerariifolium]